MTTPNNIPTREVPWNVQHHSIDVAFLYIFMILSVGIMFYGFYKKYKDWKIGKTPDKEQFLKDFYPENVKDFFTYGIIQLRVLREALTGTMHFFIFWGMVILAIGTTIVAMQMDLGINIYHGTFYLIMSFLLDLWGILLLIGILIATYRRYIVKNKRLINKWDDAVILVLFFLIPLTGYFLESVRIYVTNPSWAKWSFIGAWLSGFYPNADQDTLKLIHRLVWNLHAWMTFTFIALLPYTKLAHIFMAPINILAKKNKPTGKLPTTYNLMDLMEASDEEMENFKSGIDSFPDLDIRDLIMLDACTRCGRCTEVCPAWNTNKDLNPRDIILKLAGQLHSKENDKPFLGETITEEEVWDCTSCGACVERCPVMITQYDLLMMMRRSLVDQMKIDANARNALNRFRNSGNPYGLSAKDRLAWAGDIEVPTIKDNPKAEYLYWVGCSPSYDQRNMKIAQSFAQILNKAGVNYAVLGSEERCCGDSARRLGDEALYQELVFGNIDLFNNYGIKKIIVTCPHGFNTFLNEYPDFGSEVEVIHHTQLIEELIKEGKIKPNTSDINKITYHDPCYLGRHNGEYDAPRAILNSMADNNFVELDRNKNTSFCCGGGGGKMWYEETGDRINYNRADEIIEKDVNAVAVACPFCLTMIEDGMKFKNKEDELKVKDIAELVWDSIKDS